MVQIKKYISIFTLYPLSARMVLYIFGFALLAAILASFGHLWFVYSGEIEKLENKLASLEKEQIALLEENLWNYNTNAISIQLNGILSDEDLVYAEIRVDDAVEYDAGQKHHPDMNLKKTYTLVHDGSVIGQATFYATLKKVRSRMLMLTAGSLAAQLVGIFFTGLFVVVVMIMLLIRPIMKILDFTDTIQLENLDTEFSLNRNTRKPDELDAIVGGLNDMRKRLKRDLEEKQRIKSELAYEQAFSDTVINSLPGIFFVLAENRQFLRQNQQFSKLMSDRPDKMDGTIFELVETSDREAMVRAFDRVFTRGESVSLEVQIINPAGTPIPYLLNCSLLSLDQGRFLVGIGSDLSDRKRIEETLLQAQKMESIGTLAGGIAHDFNNILSAIFGYAEIAMMQTQKGTDLHKYLDNIFKAAGRARELVRQILTFGRKNEQESIPLQMFLVVKEALKLIRSTIPTTIEIRAEIISRKRVMSDPTQIHQIVMNLCTNAYQAMLETGGTLTVRLDDVTVSQGLTGLEPEMAPGEYILLEVSDTGCGMTKDVLEKIFDPYFTTKQKSAGTGLGLAVVHGIIDRNGGYLTVRSEPGNGSTFSAYLPVYSREEAPEPRKTIPELTDLTGHEHIMLVDDEVHVREALQLMLEGNGYTVSEYDNGRSALESFMRTSDKYDLIITDMTMPKMTGLELGQAVLDVRRDLPVILCTGFSESVSREKSRHVGFSSYLQKPVEAHVLLAEVRRLLNSRR